MHVIKRPMVNYDTQFTPGYLSTLTHTTLAGLEPTTFRLLVRRATTTGSATDSPRCIGFCKTVTN